MTRHQSGVRLQKVLAAAGLGSRRRCEELIGAGRVEVDGKVVTEMGFRIEPGQAVVHVDRKRVIVAPDVVVLALNKPMGVVTAMVDKRGAPCVGDLVAQADVPTARLFHVGRLDSDTEGLLLMTNDGELSHRLTHPSFGVSKTYVAEIRPPLGRSGLRTLAGGVLVDGRPLTVEEATLVDSGSGRDLVRLKIHEGRNRVVRRAFEVLGHEVVGLVRTEFGSVRLGRLRPGEFRRLSAAELDALYQAAEAADGPSRGL